MDLEKQEAYRESLKKIYGNFSDDEDSMYALIALVAKERDEHEEKIAMMETHYNELAKEYRDAIAMWKAQAQSALELLKAYHGDGSAKVTKQLTD